MRTKLKYVFLFLLPLLVLGVMFVHRARNPHFGTAEQFRRWAAEDIASWGQGKKFVALGAREDTKKSLSSREIKGPPLTSQMRNAYWDALLDFFYAYHDGSVESWKRFRFSGDQPGELTSYGSFQVKFYYGLATLGKPAIPDYAPHYRRFLADWEMRVKTNAPPTIDGEKDLERLFFEYLRDVGCTNLYAGYFEAVCLDGMIVNHDVYTTPPDPLYEYPFFPHRTQRGFARDMTFPNEGYWPHMNGGPNWSFFNVHPNLNELLSKNGSVDCINAFVLVKINEKGTLSPFLLRHVWDPGGQRWMVHEFVDGNLLGNDRVWRLPF